MLQKTTSLKILTKNLLNQRTKAQLCTDTNSPNNKGRKVLKVLVNQFVELSWQSAKMDETSKKSEDDKMASNCMWAVQWQPQD